MSEELKPLPCPFCGSTNIQAKPDDGQFYMSCGEEGDCKVFVIAETEAEAIAAWNRRSNDAVIEQCEQACLSKQQELDDMGDREEAAGAWRCAEVIRAMKSKS